MQHPSLAIKKFRCLLNQCVDLSMVPDFTLHETVAQAQRAQEIKKQSDNICFLQNLKASAYLVFSYQDSSRQSASARFRLFKRMFPNMLIFVGCSGIRLQEGYQKEVTTVIFGCVWSYIPRYFTNIVRLLRAVVVTNQENTYCSVCKLVAYPSMHCSFCQRGICSDCECLWSFSRKGNRRDNLRLSNVAGASPWRSICLNSICVSTLREMYVHSASTLFKLNRRLFATWIIAFERWHVDLPLVLQRIVLQYLHSYFLVSF